MQKSNIETKNRKRGKKLKQKIAKTDDPYLNVLMWATSFVVKELKGIPAPLMLMKQDFLTCSKLKMQSHGYNKDLPKAFKFKHYSPMVFRSLREKFGVSDEEFLRSICTAPPRKLATGSAGGGSEMKCYVTHDHRYIIKTMTSEDVAQIHEILERYYRFVVERKGDTLLPQYLDLFRITLDKPPGVYMIIVRNIFSARLPIHQKFNLKGSEKYRKMSEKESHKHKASGSGAPVATLGSPPAATSATGAAAVQGESGVAASGCGSGGGEFLEKNLSSPASYRDMDFLKQKEYLDIGQEAKESFMDKLKCDINFLKECNLMDYSLLLGIHDCQSAKKGDTGIDPHHALTDYNLLPHLETAASQPIPLNNSQQKQSPTSPAAHQVSNSPPKSSEQRQTALEPSVDVSLSIPIPNSTTDPRISTADFIPYTPSQSLDCSGPLLSNSPMSAGVDLFEQGSPSGVAISGEEDTGDEGDGDADERISLEGEASMDVTVGLRDCSLNNSIPSIAELDLREDVYAILSDSTKENREIYYIGLIDCLTHWGTRRKMTSTAKTVAKPTRQTTANPDDYGERLVNFMDTIIH